LKKKEYNVSFKVMISYFINIVENWLILWLYFFWFQY
jgi:hypothetical protein